MFQLSVVREKGRYWTAPHAIGELKTVHVRKLFNMDCCGELPPLSLSLSLCRHSDMVKVKQVFKRMLAEPHAKVHKSLYNCVNQQLFPAGQNFNLNNFIVLSCI